MLSPTLAPLVFGALHHARLSKCVNVIVEALKFAPLRQLESNVEVARAAELRRVGEVFGQTKGNKRGSNGGGINVGLPNVE